MCLCFFVVESCCICKVAVELLPHPACVCVCVWMFLLSYVVIVKVCACVCARVFVELWCNCKVAAELLPRPVGVAVWQLASALCDGDRLSGHENILAKNEK